MGGDEAPDGVLVIAARSGDAEAFSALYRRHVGAVHRLVISSVRDRETAADITQDVFARVIESLEHLREPDRFRPWVLAITRNAVTDHARAATAPRPLDDDRDGDLTDPDAEPDELVDLAFLVQRVRGCIAGMSSRDATVLALVTQLGYSPAEVAAALNISTGAAKVVLHRARRRLRRAIALTLLADNQRAACAVFRDAYDHGHLAQAGDHVASCAVCQAAVNDEVHLFAADPHVASTSPRPAKPAESTL